MKVSFWASALFASLLTGAGAKEHYVVKEDARQMAHKRPRVEDTVTKKCAYEEEHSELCAKYGANVAVGWEWRQEYYDLSASEEYYHLTLSLFSQQSVNLEANLREDRFYTNELDITVSEFVLAFKTEMKYHFDSKKTCIKVSSNIENFVFFIKMKHAFLEWYKEVITSPWSFDNWTSRYATWLDYFDLSDTEPITIFKEEITPATINANTETVFFGTIDDTSADCTPGNLAIFANTQSVTESNVLDTILS